MIETRGLEEMAERLVKVLPPGLGSVRRELHDNFRAVLQSQLPRLELVNREEFDAARDMLCEARQQIEALEQQVRQLEETLAERA